MGNLIRLKPYLITAVGIFTYVFVTFKAAEMLGDAEIVSRGGSVLSAIGAIAVIWQVVVEERLTFGNTADQGAVAIRDLTPENAQIARRIADERVEVRREERLRIVICIAATVFVGEVVHGWGDIIARILLSIQ